MILSRRAKHLKVARKIKKFVRRIRCDMYVKIKRILFYVEVKNYHTNSNPRNEEVIISLTSYPGRFNNLHIVIASIFKQSVKPDRIILNLCKDELKENLPRTLKMLQRQGLEIVLREKNLHSHNKYYYTMKQHPKATIITVDDDHIYSSHMIEELMQTHMRFPGCVVACRGHKILFENGKSVKYNDWVLKYNVPYQPSNTILATGVGGVLYPAGCLYKDVFDINTFQELCLNQDDLWLKVMEILKGTKVVLCDQKINKSAIMLEKEQNTGLLHGNRNNGKNDIAWDNLLKHYHFTEKEFAD